MQATSRSLYGELDVEIIKRFSAADPRFRRVMERNFNRYMFETVYRSTALFRCESPTALSACLLVEYCVMTDKVEAHNSTWLQACEGYVTC